MLNAAARLVSVSEEVHFTVQETGEIQKVTMYDAPAHALILTKRDIATNAKLTDARLTIAMPTARPLTAGQLRTATMLSACCQSALPPKTRTKICCFCPMTPVNMFTRWW